MVLKAWFIEHPGQVYCVPLLAWLLDRDAIRILSGQGGTSYRSQNLQTPPCMRMTSEQAGEALDRALAESRQRRAKDLASRIIASRNSRESGYILLEL